jgi:hypothetical protein
LEQFCSIEKPRAQQQALSQFLVNHPSLSWLQNVFNGDYKQASNILRGLAKEESELLQRKKVILYVKHSLLDAECRYHFASLSVHIFNYLNHLNDFSVILCCMYSKSYLVHIGLL